MLKVLEDKNGIKNAQETLETAIEKLTDGYLAQQPSLCFDPNLPSAEVLMRKLRGQSWRMD